MRTAFLPRNWLKLMFSPVVPESVKSGAVSPTSTAVAAPAPISMLTSSTPNSNHLLVSFGSPIIFLSARRTPTPPALLRTYPRRRGPEHRPSRRHWQAPPHGAPEPRLSAANVPAEGRAVRLDVEERWARSRNLCRGFASSEGSVGNQESN